MKKKNIAIIATFGVGLAVLVAGLVFLILNLMKGSSMQDADYLVSAQNWSLVDSEGVIWDFTEVGKGTLTTNNHENDYDFIWALEDGRLKIETAWLYALEDEYDYSLDKNGGILTLKTDETEYKFAANFDSE